MGEFAGYDLEQAWVLVYRPVADGLGGGGQRPR